MKASKRERMQAKQKRLEGTKVQQSYLYTVAYNTDLSLQVVHRFGLGVLSVILCEGSGH